MNRVEGRFFSRDLFNIFRPSPSQLDTNRMRIHNSCRFPRENSRNRRRYENFNKVELQSILISDTKKKNFARSFFHRSRYLVFCEHKLNRTFPQVAKPRGSPPRGLLRSFDARSVARHTGTSIKFSRKNIDRTLSITSSSVHASRLRRPPLASNRFLSFFFSPSLPPSLVNALSRYTRGNDRQADA